MINVCDFCCRIEGINIIVIRICVFSACPLNTYGPNCAHHCSCVNGARCDEKDGSCDCNAGFYGATCSEGQCSSFPNFFQYDEFQSALLVDLELTACSFASVKMEQSAIQRMEVASVHLAGAARNVRKRVLLELSGKIAPESAIVPMECIVILLMENVSAHLAKKDTSVMKSVRSDFLELDAKECALVKTVVLVILSLGHVSAKLDGEARSVTDRVLMEDLEKDVMRYVTAQHQVCENDQVSEKNGFQMILLFTIRSWPDVITLLGNADVLLDGLDRIAKLHVRLEDTEKDVAIHVNALMGLRVTE